MKNDIFNFNRFGKYLVADLRNAYSNYGLSLLLVSIMGVFAYFVSRVFNLLLNLGQDGLGYFSRGFIMVVCLIVTLMTVSKKCYGHVTDRRGGTNFVMIPASSLEKTLSMLFVCCIAVPLAYLVISLGADAIVCAIDPSCGHSILYGLTNLWKLLCEFCGENPEFFMEGSFPFTEEFVARLSMLANPWLYLDDALQTGLCFLLGALVFKTGKISKTMGCIILFSIASSMIVSPIALHYLPEMTDEAAKEFVIKMFSHLPLWDTISDTVVNLLLCVAVYFRVKTIKL